MENSVQYYSAVTGKVNAVTLVAHGLNVKPQAMLPLAHFLTGQGSDVYLVCLAGHHEASNIKEVTAASWHADMMAGYQLACQAAEKHAVPLYFLGYSLGALLAQSVLGLSQKAPCFSKQVLLAPAIALRRRAYLLKALFFLGKTFMLPSYSPKMHRVNKAMPLHVYQILFGEAQKLKASKCKALNIPTLVFIDPKDELISHSRLLNMVHSFQLSNYQVIELNSAMKTRKTSFHHLILSESSMGIDNWQLATGKIKAFFFE